MKTLQLAFVLMLGSVAALAQLSYDLPKKVMQFTSLNLEPQGPSTNRHVSIGNFTNRIESLRSLPAPEREPDSGLSYSLPSDRQKEEGPLAPPMLSSRVRLEDLVRPASPQGWHFGGGGFLSYTTLSERWHLVFRYEPEHTARLADFEHLSAFSLVWQYRFGKPKPAN